MKTLQCREHGGTFTVIPRRGRPPVKCTPDNVCTRFSGNVKPGTNRAAKVALADRAPKRNEIKTLAKTTRGTTAKGEAALRQKYMDELREPATEAPNKALESNANGRKSPSPTLAKAQAAKDLLMAQGWVVVGRGKGVNVASLTCSRGEETLTLAFRDGELVEQHYSLWNVDKPIVNDKPETHLSLDPDELTDSELVRWLSGMKVTWWNRLGAKEEKAVVSPDKIRVEHSFAGNGDETPADRIIHFVGMGEGFRSFRVGALLRVG